uniref:YgiT-type zinc finger domain-containing protein n=1 Tax=Candidatus Kentrum sp. LPFa TaxID=2126335 RepID=A0A450WEN9_9GAMM|nr:MAG: YgiT-type zinc finger domain-containing protein [Candidatus Kentron sp. LPFa]
MKCAICRNGNTDDGFATVLLEREGTTLVYKHVSAKICDNCGEETISSSVNRVLFRRGEEEWRRGAALEMLDFFA